MLIKNISIALIFIGALAFSSLFLKGLFNISLIPNADALALYFMSFSGSLLIVWGVLLNKLPKSSELRPMIINITALMFLLFALMRMMAFIMAEQVFTFLPLLIAQIVNVSEIGLFLLLGFLLKKHNQQKN